MGDGEGVSHLGERDCTIQRRHQKLVEVAPSPTLSPGVREKMTEAALRMAREARFRRLGTFEFLVGASGGTADGIAFMEVNPSLQVEHTVTEEVTGLDLVRIQLEIAGGSPGECGLRGMHRAGRYAMQLRINTEIIDATDCRPGRRHPARTRSPPARVSAWTPTATRLCGEPGLRFAARQAHRDLPLASATRTSWQGLPRSERVPHRRRRRPT